MTDPSSDNDREALYERLRTQDLPRASPADDELRADQGIQPRSDRGGIVVPLDFAFGNLALVTVLPPTFGDVESVVDGSKTELEMHASMCGISVEAFRSLRWSDAEKIIVAARHLAPELKAR